jgi:uncharacterized RDD family membrane protein YckC
MGMNVFDSEIGWKKRLAIVVSFLWLAIFAAIGVSERSGFAIFVMLGLFPVAVLWGIGWVWSAYRRQSTSSRSAPPSPTERGHTWTPNREADEPHLVEDLASPSIPAPDVTDLLNYPLATAWPRFFARMFDVWWTTMLVGFALGYALRYSTDFVSWINNPGSGQLFGLICIPVGLLLDAVVYTIAGNTPGKALLNLKAVTLRGEQIGFADYLNRNFRVWVYGLAMGIPLINLFTMARQSGRLGDGKPATYDEATMHRVRAGQSGFGRKLGFSVLFLAMLIGIGLLKSEETKMEAEAIRTATAKPYQWVNSATGMRVMIAGHWKLGSMAGEKGVQLPTFTTHADHAMLMLGHESFPDVTMHNYIQALMDNLSKTIRFADGGIADTNSGRPTWILTGHLIGMPSDSKVRVHVYQVEGTFWRVVSIQSPPFDYTEKEVTELRDNVLPSSFLGRPM